METTRLSTKGQIVLPKTVRSAHNWEVGTEFRIETRENGILLIPTRGTGRSALDEVAGCIGYVGKPKSLASMKEAIRNKVRSRFDRR
jgi:AbrB family looped-hinge helix DNA binding protein